jgi:hypothetical protein
MLVLLSLTGRRVCYRNEHGKFQLNRRVRKQPFDTNKQLADVR